MNRTLNTLALAFLLGAPALAQEAAPPAAPAAPVTPAAAPAAPEAPAELRALQRETEKLRTEAARIQAELALAEAKRAEALAPLNAETAKLAAEKALRAARAGAEAAAADDERAKLERTAALESARAAARLTERNNRIRELEAESKQLQLESANAVARIGGELARFQKEEEARKVATKAQPRYLKEPLVDGTLVISDRRIALNGPVTDQLAEFVTGRIAFFNNQSPEFPIFIVIDNSPGGSIAAGYQIQQAMASSKAPVYVVVKGFAASMAAVITTLAERSYCYPNTILLHHQASTAFNRANMTVLKEQLTFVQTWFERLATPVAKKMGISLKEFIDLMYKNDSTGDWQVFGDKAKELKWVDHVIARVEETSVLDVLPARPAAQPTIVPARPASQFGVELKVDAQGRSYYELPPLANPFDAYWMYDPQGVYRMAR
jgi:ATP-dependent Clp protease protease subunit